MIFFFSLLAVKFTLIGSNDYDLIECRDSIIKVVQSYSKKTSITKHELLDWPQTAIDKYYDYCLKQRVIPTIDLESTTLELFGPKEAVGFIEFLENNHLRIFRSMKQRNISMN